MKKTIKEYQLEEMITADLVKKFDESKFKTYYVSKYGTIYSQRKNDPSVINELTLVTGSNGYVVVRINNKNHYVHRIVATAFIRPMEPNEVVNHLSGNKTLNSVDELEITDYKGNTQHAWETGLITIKNRSNLLKKLHDKRKITFEDAQEIRRLHKEEHRGNRELSRMYDCNSNTIKQILDNKSYKY